MERPSDSINNGGFDNAFENLYVYGKLNYNFENDDLTVKSINITSPSAFTGDVTFSGDSLNVTNAINVSGISTFNAINVSGISTFKDNIEFHGTNGISSITFDKSQNSLKFLDESKAIFGTGDDLQIYHTNELKDQTDSNGDSVCDNRTSLIKEKGSGGLIFKSNGGDGPGAYQFFDQGWRPMLKMHGGNNARTVLYHDGNERLVTTSSGITVTGSLSVSGTISGSGLLPSGVILLWSGASNNIPTGFVLCDGNNSTPNLSGRFVVGFDASNGDYDVNDTGGAESVTLTLNQIPSHKHDTTFDNKKYFPGGGSTSVSFGGAGGYPADTFSMSNAGGGQSHENRPPFYALCYIMKT